MRSLLKFRPTRRGKEDMCGASLLPSTVPPAHPVVTQSGRRCGTGEGHVCLSYPPRGHLTVDVSMLPCLWVGGGGRGLPALLPDSPPDSWGGRGEGR